MGVKDFFDGQEFLWWVVNALSGTKATGAGLDRAANDLVRR
jgi:hypothetical protein